MLAAECLKRSVARARDGDYDECYEWGHPRPSVCEASARHCAFTSMTAGSGVRTVILEFFGSSFG